MALKTSSHGLVNCLAGICRQCRRFLKIVDGLATLALCVCACWTER